MKKLLLTALGACMVLFASAQAAVLPIAWDFETTPTTPTGWTTNTTSSYGTGVTGIAGKLNADAMFFQVEFLDEPGAVSYYLKGWVGGSVTSWIGTFTVEESDDGITWTTLHQFVDNLDVNAYVQYTDQPLSTTRYIRWFYTNKESGANTGLDDVAIATPVAGPAQEINITYGGNNVPSTDQVAFNSNMGTPLAVAINVENLGTANDLNIASATITGPAAADYNVTSTPSVISAGTNASIDFTFTPSANGTRAATLTIVNDDANENPYIVELYGIGGTLASEPTAAPTGLLFANVKTYRMQVSYTGALADGYLVVMKKNAAVVGTPTDGTAYQRGDAVGDGKVVYVGDGTSFWPKEIIANTDFHFDVYAYNGFGTYINYLDATPLSGSQTSGGDYAGTYYTGVSTSSPTFPADLGNVINPHSFEYYGNYDEIYMKGFGLRDTTNGEQVATCHYSGEEFVHTAPFDWSYFSREHSYPHSWMPTFPADNPERPEYNDFHHLFPVQFPDANQVRSNLPLGDVVNATGTYLGGTIGDDANGNKVYEPRDERKGDAARAILYMATCYDVVNAAQDWSLPTNISVIVPYGQDQYTLKQWHYNDPPSDWEKARNDFVDSVQGNRNPFIDNPDWVCYIDFETMNHVASPGSPCVSSIGDVAAKYTAVSVFPNPTSGAFDIGFVASESEAITIQLFDISGKQVYRQVHGATAGENRISLDLDLAEGVYSIQLGNSQFSRTQRVVVAH